MNMVSLCQVHQLSTEKEEENLQIVPKATPRDTNQAYSVIHLQDVKN